MYDVIIIGKGAAGISAALYTVRASLKTLVIGSGIGALENAEKIENYYGFPNGISGTELQKNSVQQAILLGCEVHDEEVLSIVKAQDITVKTNLNEYTCKRLIIATGKARIKAKIDGLERLLGHGVSMCAVCDGFFYKNRRLAVLGNGNYAVSETDELSRFTKDITIFTNGKEPAWETTLPEYVKVNTLTVKSIVGEERVEGVLLENNELLAVDGVFVALGTASAFDLAVKLGILTENGSIAVNEDYMTNVPGIYAAGDCIGGFLQISTAVGEGALAARAIIKDLSKKAE